MESYFYNGHSISIVNTASGYGAYIDNELECVDITEHEINEIRANGIPE